MNSKDPDQSAEFWKPYHDVCSGTAVRSFKINTVFILLLDRHAWVNSVDPNHKTAYDQGLLIQQFEYSPTGS